MTMGRMMLKMRWILFSVGGFMTSFTETRRLYRSDIPIDSFWVCLGLIVVAIGLAVSIYTVVVLQLSVRHPGKPATRGPYNLVRNPLYLSGIVVNVGLLIVATYIALLDLEHAINPFQVILICVGGILSYWLAAYMEERYNLIKFGETYQRYAKKVPRLDPIEGWRRLNQRRAESEPEEQM